MSKLLTVPAPVKQLFDSFPLVTYPPVEQHTSDEKQAIQDRLYSFSYDSNSSPSVHFKLGVYNVFELDDHTILASDPLCLIAQLAITLKNSIKLPKLNNERSLKKNSLFILSHHSNSRGYLPLFIEEDSTGNKKFIKDSISIDEINISRVGSSSELMLIKLIDIVLYDYWITSILFECDESLQSEIYQGYSKNELINSYGLADLLSNLVKRNGFNLRNPNITSIFHSEHSYSSTLLNKKMPKVKRGIEFEKNRNLNEFKHALENLESILSKKEGNFFTKDDKPGLLDVKLASYIILGDKYLRTTTFGETISGHGDLVRHAERVISYCS